MKRTILLFAALLIGLTTASATEQNTKKQFKNNSFYKNAEPIVFVERGIEFLVFPNGSFDFNTKNNFYNNSRRSTINTRYQSSSKNIKFSNIRVKKGVIISKDRFGKIKRIGNVFLNYDRRGNITQIGSVNINYNRGNGIVKQVGGLKVNYNRKGKIVNLRGKVNRNIKSNRK